MSDSLSSRVHFLEQEVAALRAKVAPNLPVEDGAPEVPGRMLSVDDVVATTPGARQIEPPTDAEKYRDRSMVVVCPTRGKIDYRIVETWPYLAWPMNQRRNGPVFAVGYDVASAYNRLIAGILEHPVLKTWKYIFTFEDDNLLPYDAPLRLFETMDAGPPGGGEWAAVSGLYHTKDALRAPMAYGDANLFRETQKLNFYPVNVAAAKRAGEHVIECTGIAMGCALWRMDQFREVPPPWFATIEDKIMVDGQLLTPEECDPLVAKNPQGDYKKLATQDLFYCYKAVRPPHNKRFAVDTRVTVGHLDISTGRVY